MMHPGRGRAATSGGSAGARLQGVTQGGPQGGSDTTPSTLVSFISGSTGPGWEGTQRGLEQNP